MRRVQRASVGAGSAARTAAVPETGDVMAGFKLVPVGDIESDDQSDLPSDASDELQLSASKACLEAMLLLRPMCVVPTAGKKWRVIAGSRILPIVTARFRPAEQIPVLAIDTSDQFLERSLPVVERLFGSIFNVPRPTLADWTTEAKAPVFAELGRDLNRPEVAGRFLKGRPRKSNQIPKDGAASAATRKVARKTRKPKLVAAGEAGSVSWAGAASPSVPAQQPTSPTTGMPEPTAARGPDGAKRE